MVSRPSLLNMAPITTPSRTSFPTSATRTQLVVFYIGLAVLCIVFTVLSVLFLAWTARLLKDRLASAPARRSAHQEMLSGSANATNTAKEGSRTETETPAWAMEYKQHFDLASSACRAPEPSPYGMPMLRKLDSPKIPTSQEDYGSMTTPDATPVLTDDDGYSEEQDISDSPQLQEGTSDFPIIVIDCDDTSYMSLEEHTIFPLAPVFTDNKTVIDYLSVPSPHWLPPPEDEFDEDVDALMQNHSDFFDVLFAGDVSALPLGFFNAIRSPCRGKHQEPDVAEDYSSAYSSP